MKKLIIIAFLFFSCKKEQCGRCVKTTTKTVTNGHYLKGYPQTSDEIFTACGDNLKEKTGENSVGHEYTNGYEITVKTYTTCK